MLLFPDGHFYFGSTNQKNNNRKHSHNTAFKQGTNKKKLQEQYDKQGLPKFIYLESSDQYNVYCREHHLVKEFWGDSKLLNTNMPWEPKYQKIRIEQGWEQASKQYIKDKQQSPQSKKYQLKWSQSELGKIQGKIDGARSIVRKYTKLKMMDKVDEWNKIVDDRIKVREQYHKNKA